MPSASSVSTLFGDLDVEAETDASIGAAMTWYGIGGKADTLLRPRTIEALVKRCRRSGTPLRVLGSGAKLLVLPLRSKPKGNYTRGRSGLVSDRGNSPD